MARRDEGEYPWWIFDSGATKPDGLFPENPPGGGSFVRGRRWLVPYSPLRGCAELAAWATAKIPRRSAPRSFQTGSEGMVFVGRGARAVPVARAAANKPVTRSSVVLRHFIGNNSWPPFFGRSLRSD